MSVSGTCPTWWPRQTRPGGSGRRVRRPSQPSPRNIPNLAPFTKCASSRYAIAHIHDNGTDYTQIFHTYSHPLFRHIFPSFFFTHSHPFSCHPRVYVPTRSHCNCPSRRFARTELSLPLQSTSAPLWVLAMWRASHSTWSVQWTRGGPGPPLCASSHQVGQQHQMSAAC